MKRFFSIFILLTIFTCIPAGGTLADEEQTPLEYVALKDKIEQILRQAPGVYGIYVTDIKSGKSFGINEYEPFHAASTFKVPLNIYLFEQIARGEADPNALLVYKGEHYEGGTGILQNKAVGSSYTIRELSRLSIVYSDNVAANILLGFLGKSNVKDYMRSLGGLTVDDNKNITCARDMAVYIQRLREFREDSPELADQLINYLGNTVYNDRINYPLPDDVMVAHKIGNWPSTGTYNDAGYVEHPINPYIVTIYSKNTGGAVKAFGVIRQVSKAIYDYQSELVFLKIFLDGEAVENLTPVLLGETVFIPVRSMGELLGAGVHWDGASRTATFIKSGKTVIIQDNNPRALVDDDAVTLTPTARVINNRMLVPLRFVCEHLGAAVHWDKAGGAVFVTRDDAETDDEASGDPGEEGEAPAG